MPGIIQHFSSTPYSYDCKIIFHYIILLDIIIGILNVHACVWGWYNNISIIIISANALLDQPQKPSYSCRVYICTLTIIKEVPYTMQCDHDRNRCMMQRHVHAPEARQAAAVLVPACMSYWVLHNHINHMQCLWIKLLLSLYTSLQ